MVKLTLSIFIAALVAAPALAYGSHIETASEDALFGRELNDDQTLLLARGCSQLVNSPWALS
ncbi:hypothetical protein BYT27DRAFT_7187258, partial [Phlegmacium glaucopus]